MNQSVNISVINCSSDMIIIKKQNKNGTKRQYFNKKLHKISISISLTTKIGD